MTPNRFDSAQWIEQLARALEEIAPTVEIHFTFAGVHVNRDYASVDVGGGLWKHTCSDPYELYRNLARLAEHDSDAQMAFEKFSIQTRECPTEAIETLHAHPVIRSALVKSSKGGAVNFVSPIKSFRVELQALVQSLVKLAIKTDGRNAAFTLHRFLKLGEDSKLKAYDITLLYGLRLSERLDIGNGAFLAAYDDIKETFGLPQDPSRGFLTSAQPDSESSDSKLHGVAAFVTELTWGPAIMTPAEKVLDVIKLNYAMSLEYEPNLESETAFRFTQGYEVVRDLLSIAIDGYIDTRRQYIRPEKWMDDLDPNVKYPWTTGSGWIDQRWEQNTVLDEGSEQFLKMLYDWRKYEGKRSQVSVAVRRLAFSLSRYGNFAMQDRFLDTGIALEALYSLGGSRLGKQLAQRAMYFVGNGIWSHVEIAEKSKSFYSARSSIVHGGAFSSWSAERYYNQLGELLVFGRELAVCSLCRILQNRRPPTWSNI